ncbi:High-affinity zinc uptake system ATP-binding protein ZnuC [bioreactor metagenome]|uniref:High-affinity zinc uptake system ATP-binding protein ZnuC n=1 Tax=bioreactor metagenome TaxID=1076179 RepID=A0A645A978_9ZZZZ
MIQATNLTFSYNREQPYILHDISFNIPVGEYVSVVGENGSGKTTLMKLILGFIKPSGGSILNKAQRIGYVPQKNDFSGVNFPITVYEVLDSYRHLLKLPDSRIVYELLDIVNLRSQTKSLMGDLSGGQHQKVLIARALMGNPDLLILDEPSTGIDIGSQKEIYQLIRKMNQEKHLTIISVEHNLEAAVTYSTLIYHLADGHGHFCTPDKYIKEYQRNRIGVIDNA